MNALNLQNSQNLKHCHSGYTSCLNNACTTGGMSANATGCIWSEDVGTGTQFLSDANVLKCCGSLSIGDWGCPYNMCNGGTKISTPRSISINVSHTHNFNHRHSIGSDGGDEARPNNYTVRIWKRIS